MKKALFPAAAVNATANVAANAIANAIANVTANAAVNATANVTAVAAVIGNNGLKSALNMLFLPIWRHRLKLLSLGA